ncbi:hypothetical protein LCGC14_0371910 [marine sediment metagenome]|uniref:Uncharacterized protein n=1 Tax=marine sediment metagenome TaxID=412755 RepID=A0A0F9TB10_9ZZZZ
MVKIIQSNFNFPCDGCGKNGITVRFEIDGAAMLIDLCKACINELRKEAI